MIQAQNGVSRRTVAPVEKPWLLPKEMLELWLYQRSCEKVTAKVGKGH